LTDGTLTTTESGRSLLRYERELAHPVDRVWRALTEPGELVGWLGAVELDPVEGGRVEIRWLNTDEQGNSAIARGTVTGWEPPRVLEFDTDIHGRLRWELEPVPSGTRLVFTADVALEPGYLTKVLAGWHFHLEALAEALDGHPVDWPNWPFDRWAEIHKGYEARYA
jgi:uncharacterized protein YndB with AHSA1/START domain